jgi:4-amino-4-deoxy-L-arabinose transferase-like glycosyltransferase
MTDMPRFRFADLLLLLILLAIAAGSRIWYVGVGTDQGFGPPPLHAQTTPPRLNFAEEVTLLGKKNPTERDNLIANIKDEHWFGCLAPLADKEEQTAHVAPGYPWLVALLARWVDEPEAILRWIQCALGTLTTACYFFFARRAFRSALVGALAGLLCALNPFWIINTAELNDGVLATTLLAAAIVLGTRGSQDGGAFTSLLYGLALAGLALVRAALLPFAAIGVLWFLLRCRSLRRGWLFALLAFLGFANGLAPWTVRNFQVFFQPVPIVDSAFLHLWIGNNSNATGGPQNEETLRAALPAGRLKELLDEPNQATRYRMLAQDVWDSVQSDPSGTLRRRLRALSSFVFGEAFLSDEQQLNGQVRDRGTLPEWLEDTYLGILYATLLLMVLAGLLGWRWTFAWRREARLATLAAIWIPLPYVLGHAGMLWGPRLPLDGVLLCYVAFALACLAPTVGSRLLRNEYRAK